MENFKIENLTFTYQNAAAPALKNINLELEKGSFNVICGTSGSGKSTLLRLLKPRLAPNGTLSGSIYYGARPLFSLSPMEEAKSIGFVPQNPESAAVCDKVWHEMAFGLENIGVSPSQIRARVAETAAFFGIEKLFHKNINTLSGGQKQILNLAAAAVMQPAVLILDEPAAQLDPIAAEEFLQMLVKLNRDTGTTVIMAQHSLGGVLQYADRVTVLCGGSVLESAPVDKAGKALWQKNNELVQAFPLPTRLYLSAGESGDPPVTVRGGRKWLSEKVISTKVLSAENLSAVPAAPSAPKAQVYALKVSGVRFRYEKNAPDVLHDFSLNVQKGSFCALLGGNGAGKTTAFSVITGENKPYMGKTEILKGLKTGALAQDPRTVFSHKTVRLDMEEVLRLQGVEKQKAKERIEKISRLCDTKHILDMHPYDISGGEQQRAALSVILCTKPDILLLDEPTKGLDIIFKRRLGEFIKELTKNGVTVLAVSHDIEFCAQYADSCALLFDGKIVSQAPPREFFAEKSFYTTEAARLSRGIVRGAVTESDLLSALNIQRKKMQPPPPRVSGGESTVFKSAPAAPKKAIDKKMPLFCALSLFLIALTVIFGARLFGSRKFYFISFLVIFESLIPIIPIYEKKKNAAREICLYAVFCAAAVAGRAAFAPIAQFKPMAAVIIAAAMSFGGGAGFLIGALSAFLSNFIFGQGPWTPWQMLAFGMVGLVTGLLSPFLKKRTKTTLAVYGFLVTVVIYGGIMNPASVILNGVTPTFAALFFAYVRGFPADVLHALSTFLFLWIGVKPLTEATERIKTKYKI